MALPALIGTIITAGLTYIATGSLFLALIFGGLTLISSLFLPKPKVKTPKPASLSDFAINQANENIPIPLIYGLVRIPGNILWYGNLISEPVYNKIKTGKDGGSSSKVLTGYNYYIDLWIGLCYGSNVTVERIVEDNDPNKQPSYSYYLFNANLSSVLNLEYIPLYHNNSINHIFFKKFFVGFNRTSLQTLYFVLKRTLNTPLTYNNVIISNKFIGCNPVAVLYDLIVNQSEIPGSLIDLTSWNSAATYYQNYGLGINLAITSERRLNEIVDEILKFIGAYIYYTDDGKIAIKVIKYDEQATDTIEDEFLEFNFMKKSWIDVPNKFAGTFIDAENNWTERTIIVENTAGKLLANKTITESIDLSFIIDRQLANKKLQEIVKQLSFPRHIIECVVSLKYSYLKVGQIVKIINNELGINGDFRIISINENPLREGKLRLTLLQYTEKVLDPRHVNPYIPPPPIPDTSLTPFTKIRVVELHVPEIFTEYGYPVFLFLVSREKGIETGFLIYYSTDGSNYQILRTASTFSINATLNDTYSSSTYEIDDTNQIEITCYKTYDIGQFSNLTRKNLFEVVNTNILVINNELMAFQYIQPIPNTTNQFRISSIVRKLLFTTQDTHSANSTVWLTKVEDNVIEMPVYSSTYYFKIAPIIGNQTISDLSSLQTITVTNNNLPPRPIIGRIEATRSGSTVNVKVFSILKSKDIGVGYKPETLITDTYPLPLDGTLLYRVGTSGTFTEINSSEFAINNSSAFTLQVQLKYKTFTSTIVSLSVGATDGVYIYSL